MKTLKILIKKNTQLLITLLVTILLSNAVNLSWNFFLSRVINEMTDGKRFSVNAVKLLLLFTVLFGIVNYGVTYLSGWVFEKMNHQLRMGFVRHLLGLSLPEAEKINAGEQMALLQNELSEVSSYVGDHLSDLLSTALSFIITVAFLFMQSPLLTLTITLPVLLTLFYVTFSSKVIGKYAEKAQNKKQTMNGILLTAVNSAEVISLYDCAPQILKRHDLAVDSWQQASIQEEHIRARLMSLSAVLSHLPLLLLLFVGGMLVIKGKLTIGIVYIFINLSNQVSRPLMNMPGIIAGYRRFLVNLSRLEDRIQL